MHRRIATFALLFLLLPLLASCAKKRIEDLTDRAEAYNRSIRWGSLASAGSMIAESHRRTLVTQISGDLNRQRVVDFSVVDLAMDPKETKATVVVEYSFYNIVDQDLRYRQEVQTWIFEKGTWFLNELKSVPLANQ
jgi:hypothetical protein